MANLTAHEVGREVLSHWGHPASPQEIAAYTKVEAGLMRQRICDDPQTDAWYKEIENLKANQVKVTKQAVEDYIQAHLT
jgi:hypothetical protein